MENIDLLSLFVGLELGMSLAAVWLCWPDIQEAFKK